MESIYKVGLFVHNYFHNIIYAGFVRFVGPWNITIGCEILRKESHIQSELPTSQGYIPRAQNCIFNVIFCKKNFNFFRQMKCFTFGMDT